MCSTITWKRTAYLPAGTAWRRLQLVAEVLERFKEAHPEIPTKSGLMVDWVKPMKKLLR